MTGNSSKKMSNDAMSNVVKSHLEIIVLSMLSDRSVSGYDVIKEIAIKYNVLLSQGTVYPLLHSMKEEGIIQSMFIKGDMRTKKYYYTAEGKRITQEKIDEFVDIMEYFLESIKGVKV